MRVRLTSIAFAAVTATALLSNASWAIDADAVAKALGTSFAQGREDAVSFADAFERGGQVVIKDLAVGLPEGAGTAKFTETVLDAPVENGDGTIEAATVTVTDGTIEGDDVNGAVSSAVMTDVTILTADIITAGNLDQGLLYRTATVTGFRFLPKDKLGEVTVEKVEIETGNIVDYQAQASRGTVTGVRIPVELAQQGLMSPQSLGYEEIVLDVNWDGARDPDTQVAKIDTLAIAMRDGGSLTISGALGNVPAVRPKEPQESMMTLSQLTVQSLKLHYSDDSLAGKILEAAAAKQGTTREQYAQQLAGALPFFLSMIQNPEFQNKVAAAVGQFLTEPKSLTISVQPERPISGAELFGLVQTAPQTLPDVLGASIEAND
ncbi:MAG: hypothetical protein OEU46_23635 [Alphaproteobacteria bacterium]|nr:hypothetical protein [Alphaproteobacteria bacterium]